jgi:nucleoside-diphosphate-sugar epimerase
LIRHRESEKILQHANIRLFYGDLLEPASIKKAMHGCEQVYHTAGLVRLWANDPTQFYIHNVTGTENVLSASLESGVKKLVYTSTCGVWGSSIVHPLTETDPRTNSFNSDYDLSKFLAEKLVKEYCHKGLFTVIVNPPRVYGPGLVRHSNAVNGYLCYLLKNKIAFVPYNSKVEANYAFIDDVVNGHVLAMEKGLGGERYILGGENASYHRLIQLAKQFGNFKSILIRLPQPLAKVFGWLEIMRSKVSTHDPILVPATVDRLLVSKTFDSAKAIRQLGYSITPLEKGINQTIIFLNNLHEKQNQ